MNLKDFDAFIFDMDGVIFDSERTWREADKKADLIFRTGFDDSVAPLFCGRDEASIRRLLNELKPDLNAAAYREYIIDRVRTHEAEQGEEVKAGFEQLAAFLLSQGKKLALATSSRRARAAMLFEKAGLDMSKFFGGAVFVEDVKVSKPNPEIFILAAASIGASPARTAVIEDSENGIRAAHAGGFFPIMAVDLIPPSEEMRQKSSAIVYSLSELLDVLQNPISNN